jgi:glycosyltransferase involved in cell wall biosynthesis
MPLVSVVTPSFNAAAYLRETISSVQNQDYPAIEHIVMDGGSTDGTVGILAEYPHLTWVSERDRGQSDALNKGFRRARGEIVGWLNADDVYRPGAISMAVAFLREHTEVAGVYSDCPFIDEQGKPFYLSAARKFDIRTLLLEDYIPQPTVFLRRRAIEDVGPLYESLQYVMDWEYWLRIGARHQLAYIPGVALASFRLCQGTKSNDKAPEFDLEYLRVLDALFKQAPYRDLPPWWRWRAVQLAWSRHYMTRTFAARERMDRNTVRYALPRGILHNPAWLANRGVWSTATWAFAGIGK